MDHPNIAKVLDGGVTDQGRPFFVMEYVKGVPITQYCDAARLGVAQRLELFVSVCRAVQHAHQKGIIHRDLKPSNILVAPYDDRPVPKVIDFGLAKAMHSALTERTLHTAHEAVLGTPLYMSPEQAQLNNLDIDTRSDVYSLGVLLYELLTGTTPLERRRFKEAAWEEVRRIIREEEPPKPSTRLSSTELLPSLAASRQAEPAKLARLVRGELDWIVMKALEKDRNRRYETANGFAADVERFLAGEPVLAAPPSAGYRLRKFVRRHRAGLAVAAAFAGLLLTSTVVSALLAVAASRAEERAADEARGARQAEAREAAARQLAEQRKLLAEAVNQFLQTDLLLQADARRQADALRERGGGFKVAENPTIKELLDRAATALAPGNIERRFPDQPLVQAAILRTVGQAYRAVGGFSKAVEFLTRSHETFRLALGPDHPETVEVLHVLGTAQVEAGNLRDGVGILERVRDRFQSEYGPEHDLTLGVLNDLATAYGVLGDQRRALETMTRVHSAFVAKHGPDDRETLKAEQNLAVAYFDLGQYDQSIPRLVRILARYEKLYGEDDPETLVVALNLGDNYRTVGRIAEAIRLLERAREGFLAKLGAEHPETLMTLSQLGQAYADDGQLARAIGLLKQAHDTQRRTLGADHPDTLTTVNNLGRAYWLHRQYDKAVETFEEVLRGRRATLGDSHPDTIAAALNLGANYRDAGRLDQAVATFETWLPRARRTVPPEHPVVHYGHQMAAETYERAGRPDLAVPLLRDYVAALRPRVAKDDVRLGTALALLGLAQVAAGQFAEAEPVLREALAVRSALEPDDWRTHLTRSLLGGSLAGQKKYSEAEPLLRQGYEGMKQLEAKIPAPGRYRLTEALGRLVRLYEEWGKSEVAAKWRAELESRRRAP